MNRLSEMEHNEALEAIIGGITTWEEFDDVESLIQDKMDRKGYELAQMGWSALTPKERIGFVSGNF